MWAGPGIYGRREQESNRFGGLGHLSIAVAPLTMCSRSDRDEEGHGALPARSCPSMRRAYGIWKRFRAHDLPDGQFLAGPCASIPSTRSPRGPPLADGVGNLFLAQAVREFRTLEEQSHKSIEQVEDTAFFARLDP